MSNAMKYTKAGGTVGFRIIQKGHAPEGFVDLRQPSKTAREELSRN